MEYFSGQPLQISIVLSGGERDNIHSKGPNARYLFLFKENKQINQLQLYT